MVLVTSHVKDGAAKGGDFGITQVIASAFLVFSPCPHHTPSPLCLPPPAAVSQTPTLREY